MAKYCIQKATEFSAQSAAYKREHSLTSIARTHIAQRKYDGCHLVVRVGTDGHTEAFSRTSEEVKSCEHIEEAVKAIFGTGWVVFGEAWAPNTSFPTISGLYRRHAPSPALMFVPYDLVPSGSFAIGVHDVPYLVRMRYLFSKLRAAAQAEDWRYACVMEPEYYNPGSYGNPEQLAVQLCKQGGYDGLILRDPDAHWHKDVAKNGELIKVKPVLSLDLLIVGGKAVQQATKLGGQLTVTYSGVESDVGSGLTQDMCTALMDNPAKYNGRCAEVECLGITADGKLREPRFKGFRFDKVKPD